MDSRIQRSFAGGEVAPALYGRADQAKYQTGARTCRNFMVQRYGGVTNRPGTRYICEVKDSANPPRVIEFIFNDDQTYVLEIGEEYIRFIRNAAQIVVADVDAYDAGTPYTAGDLVVSGGVNYYCIAATTGNAPPNATYWYALTDDIYEIPTPYAQDDIAALQYVQSADVITIVHPNYAPRELARSDHTLWILSTNTTTPATATPENVLASAGVAPGAAPATPANLNATGGGGVGADNYRVTAWTETAQSAASGVDSSGLTASGGSPVTITWDASVGADGYALYKEGSGGVYGLIYSGTDLSFIDDGVTPARVVDVAPPTTGAGTTFNYIVTAIDGDTGDESLASDIASCSGGTPTDADPNIVSWDAVDGASEYNVYKDLNGVYGFIGSASGTSFNDVNYEPDTSRGILVNRTLFSAAGDYPSSVSYTQQRLALANSDNNPERIWLSRVGSFHDFASSTPVQDDDAVIVPIYGTKVNEVRYLLELGGRLVIFTKGAVWTLEGDSEGILTPGSAHPVQQSPRGSAEIPPIPIDNTALFVQARGSIVRDLRFDLESDGYTGRDLSVYAPHLFKRHTIVSWCYQETPHSVVWAVRDDGVLLGLTYVREHEVWGWHRHDTDGEFESITCIPEDGEDFVYAVVKREIGGETKRYIERFASRDFDVVSDAFFVDCGLTYDGRNEDDGVAMTLSGGSDWGPTEDLTLMATSPVFSAGDVGNAIHLTAIISITDEATGEEEDVEFTLRCLIRSYTSATQVVVRAHASVPSEIQGIAITDWARAVDEVTGLDHLEGKTVAILADGFEHAQQVVTDGAVTLDQPYAVVHVGLPYTSDLETLDADDSVGPTIADRKKLVAQLTVLVEESRGFLAGIDEDNLSEVPWREDEGYEDPPDALTGPIETNLDAAWNQNGRIFIRQASPLPLTVLAVIPSGVVGKR
jgi:hypothetical protein